MRCDSDGEIRSAPFNGAYDISMTSCSINDALSHFGHTNLLLMRRGVWQMVLEFRALATLAGGQLIVAAP